MKQQRQKRSLTLIEIMIVILLIGLIGGALAFNMRGSVDKGRVFKTEQTIARVYDVLTMAAIDRDLSLSQVIKQKETLLTTSPLLKNGKTYLKDAWGNDLSFTIENEDLKITSNKLENWYATHGR